MKHQEEKRYLRVSCQKLYTVLFCYFFLFHTDKCVSRQHLSQCAPLSFDLPVGSCIRWHHSRYYTNNADDGIQLTFLSVVDSSSLSKVSDQTVKFKLFFLFLSCLAACEYGECWWQDVHMKFQLYAGNFASGIYVTNGYPKKIK